MPYTVPHQKTVIIYREPLNGSFLGINNDNWKSAARVLGAQAFLLYIYFASNKGDFKLALSPTAIQQEIGMPPSTFRDQLRKLEIHGYLVHGKGNTYYFYEVPQERATHSQSTQGALKSIEEENTAAVISSTAHAHESPPEDMEIYINKKDKETNRPEGIGKNTVGMSIDEYNRRQYDSLWRSR